MASPARVGKTRTLDQCLRVRGIDARPYREYIDGRIETKPYLGARSCLLMVRLAISIDLFAEPMRLGEAFMSLRCTFAGRSVVAAIAFLDASKIQVDDRGVIIDDTHVTPDLYVECSSPEELSDHRPTERLEFATRNACPLGWLIDANRLTVHEYRPRRRAERVPADGILEGDPVLPGYRLPVAQLFEWLKIRRPRQKPTPPSPQTGSPTDGGPDR